VIKAMLSLRCAAGHRWYAPNVAAWIDHRCERRGSSLETDKPTVCRERLRAVAGEATA
jgi:hypothetical protein